MKQAIVVLGMHRSGTSMVTGALAQLGATPPKSEMPPTGHNPKGYFESLAISDFNDRLLHSLGSCWYDWRPLDASDLPQVFTTEACDLMADEFEDADTIVLKDPRICRLVPAWRGFLDAAGYAVTFILPVRGPEQVALSLGARNGFYPDNSRLLWLQHVLSAERHTRGLPRHILQSDAVAADWKQALLPALHFPGLAHLRAALDACTAGKDHVDPALFHMPDNTATASHVASLARRVYAVFDNPGNTRDGLDDLAAEFQAILDGRHGPVADIHAEMRKYGIVNRATAPAS